MQPQLQRLREAQIEVADLTSYFALAREGLFCLVGRTKSEPPGFGEIGSVCKLTDQGLAVLVWEGNSAYFVAKGSRQGASAEDIDSYLAFTRDLKDALNHQLE